MHALSGKGLSKRRVLLVLVVAAILIISINQFTGMISKFVGISMSINPSVQGNIYIVNVSEILIQDTQTEFVFAVENIGSLPINGSVYVEIRNWFNNTVDSFNSSSYSLLPGSYMTDTLLWYAAHPPGNYTILAWDNYTNSTDTDSYDFSIECVPGTYRCFGDESRLCNTTSWVLVDTCYYGCQNGVCNPKPEPGGEGAAPAAPSAPAALYNMSIEYEGVLEAVQGMNYTQLLRVTNNGGNPLTNLVALATSDDLYVSMPDIRVNLLAPGESVNFVLNIGVPEIPLGEYIVSWQVSSSELTRSGRISVSVVSTLEEYGAQEICKDAIERYFDLLKTLDMDIGSAEIRGYDMDVAKKLLNDALSELEVMRDFRNRELYEECSNRVDILRRKIEQAAMVYAVAIGKPVSIIAYPWIEHVILIFAVIALVVVIIFILGWRRVSKSSTKKKLYLPREW